MADEPGPVYRASKRRFPWADVRGFEIGPGDFRAPEGNARHRIPIVEVATRRVPAETVRAELERYWRAHRR